jgi:hypothetical protein
VSWLEEIVVGCCLRFDTHAFGFGSLFVPADVFCAMTTQYCVLLLVVGGSLNAGKVDTVRVSNREKKMQRLLYIIIYKSQQSVSLHMLR